jgi:hypothetical protein
MPVIIINGVPETTDPVKLEKLKRAIAVCVAEIEELNITAKDVSILFPRDLSISSGKEIIVFVDGLLVKPERTRKIRQNLANVITLLIVADLDGVELVECFVRPFNPRQGFVSWRK